MVMLYIPKSWLKVHITQVAFSYDGEPWHSACGIQNSIFECHHNHLLPFKAVVSGMKCKDLKYTPAASHPRNGTFECAVNDYMGVYSNKEVRHVVTNSRSKK